MYNVGLPNVPAEHGRFKANTAFHPSGSVNEYQLRLGRQVVWFIPLADECGVCRQNCEIPWECVPYLSALKVCSRRDAIQIRVYLYLYLLVFHNVFYFFRRTLQGLLYQTVVVSIRFAHPPCSRLFSRESPLSLLFLDLSSTAVKRLPFNPAIVVLEVRCGLLCGSGRNCLCRISNQNSHISAFFNVLY